MSENICIDIETLSTQSNAVIVSVSAVKFSLNSDAVETFSINLNPLQSKELGLHICPKTIDWWRQKGKEAVSAWQTSRIDLSEGLERFKHFCGDNPKTKYFANGTNFDFPILESSFRAVGKKEPWKYYNLVDMRTIFWLTGFDIFNSKRIGTYHVGIDDCLTQIYWMKAALSGKSSV